MNSKVISALLREKELLQEILRLAECQPELVESARLEDLEMLLSLRSGALSEMAAIEEAVETKTDPNPMASTEDLRDQNKLNLAILDLVERIVDIDEKTNSLANHLNEDCDASEPSTETDA